jgi:hypothetical protein
MGLWPAMDPSRSPTAVLQPTGSRGRRNWWCRGQHIETGTRYEKEMKPLERRMRISRDTQLKSVFLSLGWHERPRFPCRYADPSFALTMGGRQRHKQTAFSSTSRMQRNHSFQAAYLEREAGRRSVFKSIRLVLDSPAWRLPLPLSPPSLFDRDFSQQVVVKKGML